MITQPIQQTYSQAAVHTHQRATETSARPDEKQEDHETRSSQLSERDLQKVQELKARDREVRAHEQAHLSAAGSFAKGGASYTYERGPDQRMYAVGGEVHVDTSAVTNDPVATLRKAQVIRRAALAPANPSSQDRQVAAQATQMAQEAQAEIAAGSAEQEGQSERETDTADTNNKTETKTGCPACGGAHSSAAHDGMSAYAATEPPPSETFRATA